MPKLVHALWRLRVLDFPKSWTAMVIDWPKNWTAMVRFHADGGAEFRGRAVLENLYDLGIKFVAPADEGTLCALLSVSLPRHR